VYHGPPPGNWHGGWYGHHYYPHNQVFFAPFPSVFVGSGFGFGYYPYPYYYPYGYPYPYYGYPYPGSYSYPPPGWSPDQQYPPDQGQPPATPPPPDSGSYQQPPPDAGSYQPAEEAGSDVAPPPDTSSYGMVQLRSVPDGSAIDFDGRYWFDARQLDDRWLSVPPGLHTITVRQPDHAPVARRVDVSPGRSQVISLESFSNQG
jgi:hypothetical protein